MSASNFAILCLLVPTAIYAVASVGFSLLCRKPRQASRWRRFRVSQDALLRGGRGTVVVQEEDGKFQLRIIDGSAGSPPLRVGRPFGNAAVRVDRRLLTLRATVDVHVHGRPWLALRPGKGPGFPELWPIDQATASRVENSLAASTLTLQGSLAAREFEVRVNGRLVASVSWQHGEKRSGAADQYYVEVVQSAPVIPLLALVLGLEVVVRIQKAPRPAFSRRA